MKIFQPKYRDKQTGKVKRVQHWYIGFTDKQRLRRRLPAFPNKASTERASMMVKELLSATGGLPEHVVRWLEEIPTPMRDRLVEWGLVDGRKWSVNLGKPLTEHLADYAEGLRADRRTPGYVKQTERQVRLVLDGCSFKTATDIDGHAVKTFLARGRGPDGYGERTYNALLRSFKGFCSWLCREGRAVGADPMRDCSLIRQTEFRKQRRALTPNEMQRLIAAAESAGVIFGMPGRERALLYTLAVESGLRMSEIRSLRRLSFDFAADPASVHLDAADTKGKQAADIILFPETARALRAFLEGREPQDAAFNMPHPANIVVMFRADLEAAGIPYTDDAGRDADAHALRHTFITNLSRAGVHPAVAQKLARHSSITLTMRYYTHVLRESEISAMTKLADLSRACQNGAQVRILTDVAGQRNSDSGSKTALSA